MAVQFSTSSSLQTLSKSRTAPISTRNQTRTFDFDIRSQWEGLDADAGAHLGMMSTVHLKKYAHAVRCTLYAVQWKSRPMEISITSECRLTGLGSEKKVA